MAKNEKKETQIENNARKETETQTVKGVTFDQLEALNQKLDRTIQRIANLEEKIDGISPELSSATGSLNMTLSILRTFQEVTNVATIFSPSKWLMRLRPEISLDPIERAIIDVLTREGSKNISQLTAAVRRERGSASRRIIREKVNQMIKQNIVEEVDEGYGRVVKMAIDLKELTE
ncbi:MAG: hypothetical protein GF308_17465 [Candidatus Heimdallarchaeota archaeon]|nr:hypothetical protein [Candidatus Heimdallarchaeota archaeon]